MDFSFAYYILLWSMLGLAFVVFIALYMINAGYGMLRSGNKWGLNMPNSWGWFLMEAPIFICMLLFWVFSERRFLITPFVIFLLFQTHYFHRALVFPFILRGKSKIPILIVFLGLLFNTINSILQGGWLFYLSPADRYPVAWLYSPQFIIGTLLFFSGMVINMHSDKVIRNLRKPGDNRHYLPKAGMFRYVTSANYFGEILEWSGFAILTWSLPALVFALWTAANLVPRANSIYKYYRHKFAEEMQGKNLKRVFPFVY